MTLNRLPTRLTGSPMPLSSTPIWASRVNVVSLATAQRDGLAQAVDLLLGRALELAQRGAAASDELVDVRRLLRGDRSRSPSRPPRSRPVVGCAPPSAVPLSCTAVRIPEPVTIVVAASIACQPSRRRST